MFDSSFDVIVIGGGINGAGVARDCCLRGFRTALVEAKDFGSGATGASSGLIHGGPRYLLNHVPTTKMSCLDSGFIQQLTPQMLFRVPFLVPYHEGSLIHPELVETFFSAYDRFAPLKNSKPHSRLTKEDCLSIEPGLVPSVSGGVTFDEWGVNPMRLTFLNILDANRHGLEVWNHSEVLELMISPEVSGVANRRVHGIVARTKSGHFLKLRAKVIVNLTGPWAPKIGRLAGLDIQIRPSKGVHLVLDRRYTNVAIVAEGIDGRDQMFIMPHESTTLLGATDDDYFGDPGNIPITDDEISYILDAGATIVPAIRKARVIRAFAGIRPTLFQRGRYESDLSREHKILDHEIEDQVAGLITMIGGKLAAYRLMSEECTDLIARKLNSRERCRTHKESLPGGEGWNQLSLTELEQTTEVPEFALSRIRFRHGSELKSVIDDGTEVLGTLANQFACPCEPVTFAEMHHCMKREWCESLDDLRRRTRFGMGPCSGAVCTSHGANFLASTHDLSPEEWHREWLDFLQERFKGRRGGGFTQPTAQQDEYIQSLVRLSQSFENQFPSENCLEEFLG